ncbi:MAG: helix-turn-helix domain-containing protein [Novosphingobium sp.]|nr:helix-turn-helix domain-containing protein [Novosphingobium sp.]
MELTLEELSERTGVEVRTLRSWVSEGLLAPPLKPGRGARYPASNVDRALAVRALKEVHGLSFAEISRRFMMANEEQIRSWAVEASAIVGQKGSARDYLRSIRQRSTHEYMRSPRGPDDLAHAASLFPSRERVSAFAESFPKARFLEKPGLYGITKSDLTSIERLIFQLERVVGAPAPRRSRGTTWTRIAITPDLELSVRGELKPGERVLFEQLADQLRAILIGRSKHD